MIFFLKIVHGFLNLPNRLRWKVYYMYLKNTYKIHPSFIFNGVDISFYGDGEIIIARNSYIGSRSSIQVSKGAKVVIGEHVAISHNVRIYTENRNANDIIMGKDVVGTKQGDVSIGNYTWIGANVFIKEGVTIGNHCVIGANSVVVKEIPSNTVAAGNPARIIKIGL